MLVMIEVRNSYAGHNVGGEGTVGRGVVDLRQADLGISVLTLLKNARPVDTPTPSDVVAKNPSLYDVLPTAVRASLNKAQATVAIPKAKTRTITTRSVACKKYWHPSTKTHNTVEINFSMVSVPVIK